MLVAILLLCLINGICVVACKKSFGKCMPITMLSIPVLLFMSGVLFSNFSVAFYLIVCSPVALIPLLIINRKQLKFVAKNYFSAGFWMLLIIGIAVTVIDRSRTMHTWDELSHWGVMTKELVRLNNWYSVGESRLLGHKDYPPFIPLWEMFWCRLNGGYSERVTYYALHTLELSFILMPLESIYSAKEKKKIDLTSAAKMLAFMAAAVILVRLFDPTDVFVTIYLDVAIAIIFAYGLINVFTGTGISLIDTASVSLCMTALVLTKQIGVVLAAIIFVSYICCYFAQGGKVNKNVLCHWMGAIVLPVFSQIAWKRVVVKNGADAQFSLNGGVISKLWMIVKEDNPEQIETQTLIKFIKALFTKNVVSAPSSVLVTVTYITALILVLLGLQFLKKNIPDEKKKTTLLQIVLAVGAMGYAAVVGASYMVGFSVDEMLELASFPRYIGTFVIAEYIVTCAYVLVTIGRHEIKVNKILAYAGIMLVVVLFGGNFTAIMGGVSDEYNAAEKRITNYLEENIDGPASVLIFSEDTIKCQLYVNYYADDINPVMYDVDLFSYELNEDLVNGLKWTLSNANYVYVRSTNEILEANLKKVDAKMDVSENSIYSVIIDNDMYRLEKIAG